MNPADIASVARLLLNVFFASDIKSPDEQEKLIGGIVLVATFIWTIVDNRRKTQSPAPK